MNKNMSLALKIAEEKIKRLMIDSDRVIIAIDGMSGSGKTTFANALAEDLSATLIHMDDFFLRPEQRTDERLNTIGGNVDVERLLDEVIIPIYNSNSFTYKPFNCHKMDFSESQTIKPENIVIIEGSYSCHSEIFDFFDLHIFLYTDTVNQISRILKRNGYEKAKIFMNKWIPLENEYFEHFGIREKCELQFYI